MQLYTVRQPNERDYTRYEDLTDSKYDRVYIMSRSHFTDEKEDNQIVCRNKTNGDSKINFLGHDDQRERNGKRANTG